MGLGCYGSSKKVQINVLDCAKILNVLTGYDPEDEYTFVSVINGKKDYVKSIEDVNFKNCKIGILRSSFGSDDDSNCKPVNEVVNSYLSELKDHGANFVDVDIEGVYDLIVESSMYTEHSKYDMNNFLKSRKNIPYDDISTIVTEKKYHECLDLLEVINKESPEDPYSVPEYYKKYKSRDTFQNIEHPIAGTALYPKPSFVQNNNRISLERSPLLGEHNEEYL